MIQMKRDKLTFGTKINCTFAALAAVLALSVWYGFHTAGSLSDSLENATRKTTRKVELAGTLDTAKSNMAVGNRSVILFSYAKDSGQLTWSKQLFRDSSESFRKALADIGPLLVTEEGKQFVSQVEASFGQWIRSYTGLEQLSDPGNPYAA